MYGGLTPKRHIAWSNSRQVRRLDLGAMVHELRRELTQHRHKSTRKYKTKGGKTGFSGSSRLKATQRLAAIFCRSTGHCEMSLSFSVFF